MKINPDKCVACGNCTYVCPMGAIYIDPAIKRATVDRNECVECYACFNGLEPGASESDDGAHDAQDAFQSMRLRFDPEPDVCPTAAFEPDELDWPRVVRRAFSDPRVPHESTGVEGRGTEEVKTNDVSGRVKVGEVGFTIEFGRPGVGVLVPRHSEDVLGAGQSGRDLREEEPDHVADVRCRDRHAPRDILDEKVMSAIVEIKVAGRAHRRRSFGWLHEVEKQLDTS